MVFFDDFLYFLKIQKNTCRIHQNYLVALTLTALGGGGGPLPLDKVCCAHKTAALPLQPRRFLTFYFEVLQIF